MRITTVLGARPQFIKSAPVSWALREGGHEETLVHTGQHYDEMMSDVFFRELDLPAAAVELGIGSGPHGWQTGQMLTKVEDVLVKDRPDLVLVYGDTNSTLAGALAACKLEIPVAHVEAGLRSYNRSMPEEHNRVLTDHCSALLFCPTATAIANLAREGLTGGVHHVGDTMLDLARKFLPVARGRSDILSRLALTPKQFSVATIHRPYNTDDRPSLANALAALAAAETPVVLPLHPRTRGRIDAFDLTVPATIRVIDPVGYFDMLMLVSSAEFVLTDSGGVQKEAFFLGTPCITLRPETEWVETVESGWNRLTCLDAGDVRRAVDHFRRDPPPPPQPVFGGGAAGRAIAAVLERWAAA